MSRRYKPLLVAGLAALGVGVAIEAIRQPPRGAANSPSMPIASSTLTTSLSGPSSEPSDSVLAGRTWKLVAFTFDGRRQALATGVTVTLRFFPQRQLAGGAAGCNEYGAFYTLAPARAQLLITGHYQTQMACLSQQRMQQETRYLSAFDYITTFHLNAVGLTLSDSAGRFVLRFS